MKDYSLNDGQAPKPSDDLPKSLTDQLDILNDIQLMSLRHELDMRLEIGVDNINLTEELSLQFRQGKTLLAKLLAGNDTPANQIAQVFNSTQAQIEKIVKMRAEIRNQERLKRYESAFLGVLEKLGNAEAREVFLDMYGEFLKDRGD